MNSADPDPGLQALADWFDHKKLDMLAEAIRDWHVTRDGSWRNFSRELSWQLGKRILPASELREAKRLLRLPRSQLARALT